MIWLEIFGLLFGVLLVLDGIFEWGLARVVRPTSRTELRVSEVVIGLILIVLAILLLVGVI